MLTSYIISLVGNILQSPSSLLLTVLALIAIYFLQRRYRNDRLIKFAKQFSGPATWPLLGNSLDFLLGGETLMKKISEYTEKYSGVPYRLWIGSQLFIVISDAEEIETVLYGSTTADKPKLVEKFYAYFGESAWIIPEGDRPKQFRKKLIPVFHKNILARYIPTIQEKTDDLLKLLEKHSATGQVFDLWSCLPYTAFDIITKTMINLELDHNDRDVLRFHELEKSGTNLCFLRMMCPIFHNDFLDNLIFGRRIKHLKKELSRFLKTSLQKKIDTIKSGSKFLEKVDEENFSCEGEDALSLYMKIIYDISQAENNEEVLYTEMITIMEAGTSPIALVLSFCLISLAIHQDFQQKVYDEICDVIGTDVREIRDTDLSKLTYTTQVLQETMRRFAGVFIFRGVKQDTKIGQYVYPAGATVAVSMLGVHLNPKYYKNPKQFNPENFSPDAVNSRNKCSFVTFSSGPRNCIGYPMAMVEMKIILARLLSKYKFTTPFKSIDDIQLECGFMFTSKNGYPVIIKPRSEL